VKIILLTFILLFAAGCKTAPPVPSAALHEPPEMAEPSELAEMRSDWNKAQRTYQKRLEETMDRYEKDIDEIKRMLAFEDLEPEEREDLYRQLIQLESEYEKLDREEDIISAVRIVRWANRKAGMDHFLDSADEFLEDLMPGRG